MTPTRRCAALSLVHLVLCLAAQQALAAAAPSVPLADVTTTLLHPSSFLPPPGTAAAALLHHLGAHVQHRSGVRGWGSVPAPPRGTLDLCPAGAATALLRLRLQPRPGSSAGHPGSFALAVHVGGAPCNGTLVVVAAPDVAGIRDGLGRLGRELRVRAAAVGVPASLSVVGGGGGERALWALRGHQYTAAHHPSMFRTWDLFDTFTRDNAVFGTNQVELAHFGVSGAADVPNLVQYATRLDKAGVNVSFWWSLSLFTGNRTATEAAWRGMPRIDSVFFPGGDGGALVWPDVKAAAAVLHAHHPAAKVWVSAQEFGAADLADFFETIATPTVRAFLHGVVVGPHWSIPTAEIARRMPSGYPLRQYPDICHPRGAQYAIADWHWAWQATAGRQMINPQPLQHSSIVRLRSNGSTPTTGVGAYSEGLNDDLNKAVWSGLAADPSLSVEELVAQYARYFFGADAEEAMTAALFGLEQNWAGDIGANEHVLNTLAHLQAVERRATVGELASNWRLQMYLYRGYFDAVVQAEYRAQQASEARAREALARAPTAGSRAAIASALAALDPAAAGVAPDPAVGAWRGRLYAVRGLINASIGTEVLQGQDTALNLDGVYYPLSDAPFLNASLARLSGLASEADRLAGIAALLGW